MPHELTFPINVRRTKARVCVNCPFRMDPPLYCRRLVDGRNRPLEGNVPDRARALLKELGQAQATCSGWRYPYMVSEKHLMDGASETKQSV